MKGLTFRPARRDDLQCILTLLADDPLGKTREEVSDQIAPDYLDAFEAMSADPNQIMAVAELNGDIAGCMQITFIPGLSRKGAWRGQLESIRVASHLRGKGVGAAFMAWAIEECRQRGCRLVQLTSDQTRADALRFYETFGFVVSHHGLKLNL